MKGRQHSGLPPKNGDASATSSTNGVALPPLGVNLYVTSVLAKAYPKQTLRRVVPDVAGSAVLLILVSAMPALTSLR